MSRAIWRNCTFHVVSPPCRSSTRHSVDNTLFISIQHNQSFCQSSYGWRELTRPCLYSVTREAQGCLQRAFSQRQEASAEQNQQRAKHQSALNSFNISHSVVTWSPVTAPCHLTQKNPLSTAMNSASPGSKPCCYGVMQRLAGDKFPETTETETTALQMNLSGSIWTIDNGFVWMFFPPIADRLDRLYPIDWDTEKVYMTQDTSRHKMSQHTMEARL